MCGPPGYGKPSRRATLSSIRRQRRRAWCRPRRYAAPRLRHAAAKCARPTQSTQARPWGTVRTAPRYRDMSDDVVDAVDRLVRGPCQRFRRREHADRETAGEAGSRGYGDRVDVGQRYVCVGQSFGDAWHGTLRRARERRFRESRRRSGRARPWRHATTLEMRCVPCTMAAAVSSQVDSMPSTIGSLIAAPLCVLLKCALVSAVALKPTTRGSKLRLMVYASMPSGGSSVCAIPSA